MAAGKSTVAQAVAERLDPSVHLRGDVFRKMIVRGAARMDPVLSESARAQLRLRQDLACAAARQYLAAGFNVVYQDILVGDDLTHVAGVLADLDPEIIVLVADVQTLAQRDADRSKQAYGPDFPATVLADALAKDTPRLGLWLDTAGMSVDTVVGCILGRREGS